jgi:hypothetical protein
MTSGELIAQLNQPPAAVKNLRLIFEHKTFTGMFALNSDQAAIPFEVDFKDCEFPDGVRIADVEFEHSVVFSSVKFETAFDLERVHIKGDLTLSAVGPLQPPKGQVTLIQINQAIVDGNVHIQNPVTNTLQMENLKAANLFIPLTTGSVQIIDLRKLDTGRVSISARQTLPPAKVQQLHLDNSTLSETLALQNLELQTVTASNLTVLKATYFLSPTIIERTLDLSSANLGSFDWEFPWPKSTNAQVSFQLPQKLIIDGTTFSSLHARPVHPSITAKPTEDEREKLRQVAHTDYGLVFLEKGDYFEPAYTNYESWLRGKGQTDQADAVYFAMRDRRRYTELLGATTFGERALAAVNYVIGFGHKWLFGYGRSWIYPMVWCVIFIVVGTFVFRDVRSMEKLDDDVPYRYSPLWYSVDLFVPILSLGIAKAWRPKQTYEFLEFYSKLLGLIGLVFLSAVLGALTGSLK